MEITTIVPGEKPCPRACSATLRLKLPIEDSKIAASG
jgi:hypothetical protein